MSQERFYILAAKVLSKEASSDEISDFKLLIEGNQEWKATFLNLEELWNSQPDHSSKCSATEEAYLLHLGRLKDRVKDFEEDVEFVPHADEDFQLYPRKKKWYQKGQLYAVALVLIIVSIFSVRFFNHNNNTVSDKKPINEVNVTPGSKTKLQLPDGSHVWVNSDSKLSYPETFKGAVREVFLEGEAYFDVVKDATHPFIVHTSGIDIKVLGTAFNVKAYAQDKQTEASLIRGSIEVTIKNRPLDKIILSPNEKLVVENNSVVQKEKTVDNIGAIQPTVAPIVSINKLKYSPVDSAIAEIQWIDNKLIFRDESFADVAVKMERWYDVSIKIKDPVLSQSRLTGIFHTETILQALDALKISIPFNYQQTGNKIIIHR